MKPRPSPENSFAADVHCHMYLMHAISRNRKPHQIKHSLVCESPKQVRQACAARRVRRFRSKPWINIHQGFGFGSQRRHLRANVESLSLLDKLQRAIAQGGERKGTIKGWRTRRC